ncbi:MAG TPA: hypothetical protein VFX88_25885 [Actinomycetota bacterium]|jgi:hypothetical protein|nr:hypothetical protein [Actinomycetota bacterium]
MSMGPDDARDDQDRDDPDREPNSAAGAASGQAEMADDKEQSEGDPD